MAGLNQEEQDFLDELSERQVALKQVHLTDLATRAASLGLAGVVVCAFSDFEEKAEPIVEAVQLKMVSRLIVPPRLARALNRML